MDRKFVLIILVATVISGVGFYILDSQKSEEAEEQKEVAVRNLVESFGEQLEKVSLQAPEEQLRESLQEHYSDFVAPELLENWAENPLQSPGRLTSSPWPERIEVDSIEKRNATSYRVSGRIIEITSVEKTESGVAAERDFDLVVEKINGNWLIANVSLGDYIEPDSIVYHNTEYGFSFRLPDSWENYSIIVDNWEGREPGGPIVERGPLIKIRHPAWTSENPRQDIPIMVFTLSQWKDMQGGDLHIGAAPINPSELGRNEEYVFALPARYNYAFPLGWQEVEEILRGDPLTTEELGKENEKRLCGAFDFNEFPVGEIYEGEISEPDFETNQAALTFRTRIREGVREGTNFAGHYTVIEWGCGTGCQAHAVVDVKTGKIVSFGLPSVWGADYKIDSFLLVLNPYQNLPVPAGSYYEETKTSYYLMRGGELRLVCQEPLVGE